MAEAEWSTAGLQQAEIHRRTERIDRRRTRTRRTRHPRHHDIRIERIATSWTFDETFMQLSKCSICRTFPCSCTSLINSDANMTWPDASHLRRWLDRTTIIDTFKKEDQKRTTASTQSRTDPSVHSSEIPRNFKSFRDFLAIPVFPTPDRRNPSRNPLRSSVPSTIQQLPELEVELNFYCDIITSSENVYNVFLLL